MKRYYVCRTYSHTDKEKLIKVISRGIVDKQSANDWKEYEESLSKNKKHKFFVIEFDGDHLP